MEKPSARTIITAAELEAAKDVFKNVKHALPIEDISEKYKFLLDEIPRDKEFDEEFSEGRLIK